jgi:hypothetical protein
LQLLKRISPGRYALGERNGLFHRGWCELHSSNHAATATIEEAIQAHWLRGSLRSVDGHRNAVNEARETRDYNRRMKEIEAEREANKPLTEKLAAWVRSLFHRSHRG